MQVTIRKSLRRSFGERFITKGFNVFVTSNATEFIDNWFNENEIWKLSVKSKAWAKLTRACNKLNINAMRTVFGDDCNIVFSHYAGCSMCPCSPGFRVRKCTTDKNRELFNTDVWMDIEVDLAPLVALLDKCDEMLKAERELAHAAQ